jgi:hypothetical protein
MTNNQLLTNKKLGENGKKITTVTTVFGTGREFPFFLITYKAKYSLFI